MAIKNVKAVYAVKMADVAARREARRRRILENSQNRLQYISGKSDDENIKAPLSEQPVTEFIGENNIPPESSNASTFPSLPQYNGVIFPDPELNELISNETIAAGDHDRPLPNDLAAFVSTTVEPVQEKSFLQKFVAHKYDIVLLSLLIQILYGISLLTLDNTYFFLPLIIYTCTKSMWISEENNMSSIASIFLLMNGISAQRASKYLYVTQWFSILFKDVSIYLFTTICVQSLIFFMKSYSVT